MYVDLYMCIITYFNIYMFQKKQSLRCLYLHFCQINAKNNKILKLLDAGVLSGNTSTQASVTLKIMDLQKEKMEIYQKVLKGRDGNWI